MAKQLNVDMRFTADTSQAKTAINELQSAIQKLGYGSASQSKGVLDPATFEKASAAARELGMYLNQALNPKTGNLDLSRLNASLKASGTSLTTLTSSFKDAGSTGQQAFVALAKSIAMADQPTINVNTHLQTMFTTLKNVARFQISSSVIHGLIGGVQTAYHYAQDLNESLNNIRIVTGQSTDQMAKFARQANNSAKELNATTLDYTRAALLYYQQGLDDSAAQARTEITLKMANVSRQSAEEVSNQLTAIWNNFDDGTKSLESYADVITALGAATASSSEEIATGIEKFASVAKTIGLSYDYAATALATITAQTRQSADSVGTGLRTLFSRLQSLKLGESLEDGTTLTKYSQALESIGVSIKSQNGELKDMDTILNEMGAKWETLSKDQQTALAQTVGGVRQYTTLVALMDNWDKFQQNLSIAQGSEGALQNQADIYAESWEAARDRIKAAMEGLYDTLINDKFFIELNNTLEKIITGVDKFIQNLGGVKAVIGGIAAFTLSAVSGRIGPAIQKVVQDIRIMTGGADKVYTKMQEDFKGAVSNELASGKYTTTNAAELQSSQALLLAKTRLSAVNNQLNSQEKMRNELAMQGFQMQADEIKKQAQEVERLEKLQKQAAEDKTKYETEAKNKQPDDKALIATAEQDNLNQTIDMTYLDDARQSILSLRTEMAKAMVAEKDFSQLGDKIGIVFDNLKNSVTDTNLAEKQNELRSLQATFQDLFKSTEYGAQGINAAFRKAFSAKNAEEFKEAISDITQKVSTANIPVEKLGQALKALGVNPTAIKNYTKALEEYKVAAEAAQKAGEADTEATKRATEAKAHLDEMQKRLTADTQAYNPQHAISPIEGIAKAAAGLGQAVMVINSFKSAIQTLGDESATVGEKITSIMMAISMGVPSAIGVYQNFLSIAQGLTNTTLVQGLAQKLFGDQLQETTTRIQQAAAADQAFAAAKQGTASATQMEQGAINLLQAAEIRDRDITISNTTTKLSKAIAQKMAAGMSKEEAINALLAEGAITADEAATLKDAGAKWKLVAANLALNASMLATIAIIALVVAAIAAIGLVIYDQISAYNADAIAAEKAAKAAETLGKKSQEAAQRAQSIKQAFDGYDSAVDKLRSCTKGTEEWNDALKAVNDSVLKLMEDYPDLVGEMDVSRDENGMLTISNKDAIIAKAEAQADAARQTALMSNVSAAQAQQKADETTTYRKFEETAITGNGNAYTVNNAAIARNAQRSQIINNATDYQGLTLEQFKKSLEENGMDISIATEDFYKAIQELADGANSVAKKMENTANAIADTHLGDEFGEAEKEIASEAYEEAYNTIYEDVKTESDKLARNSNLTNDDGTLKKLWSRYNAAMGTDYSLSSNPVQGNDQNRIFEYLDNGEKKQASLAEVAAAIAAAEALGTLTDSAQAASEALKNIDAPTGTDNEGWNSFAANKDFRDWTGQEIKALRDDYKNNFNFETWKENNPNGIWTGLYNQDGSKQYRNAENAQDAYLSERYGGLGLSGEHVAAFTKELEDNSNYLETYYADVAKAREATQGQGQDFATRQAYSQALQNSPGAAGLLALSESQQNAMTKTGMAHAVSAFNKAGEAGGTSGASLVGRLLNSIDPSELDDIAAQLDKFDASTWIDVDLNDVTDLPGLIAALQKEADSNPIEIRAKLDLLEGAKEALKEDMTSTEWKKYFEDYGDALGLTDAGSQADFMSAAFNEQQRYIDSQGQEQRQNDKRVLEEVNAQIAALEAYQSNKNYNEEDLTNEQQKIIALDDKDPEKAKQVAEALAQAHLEAEMIKADLTESADKFHSDDLTDEEWETAQSMAEIERERYAARAEALEDEEGYDAHDYNKDISENIELTEEWAAKQMKVHRGAKQLQEDYDDILNGLQDITESTDEDWLNAMKATKKALSDITGLPLNKVTRNLVLMAKQGGQLQKIARGNKKEVQEAIKEVQRMATKINLGKELGKQFKVSQKALEAFDNAMSEADIDEAFQQMLQEAQQTLGPGWEQFLNGLSENYNDFMNFISTAEPGDIPPPNVEAFAAALAGMVLLTGGTVQDINSILGGISGGTMQLVEDPDGPIQVDPGDYQAKVKGQEGKVGIGGAIDYEYCGHDLDQQMEGGGTVKTFKLQWLPGEENAPAHKGGGGGGGGGGGKPKTPRAHKKSDTGKRYHRVNEQIADTSRKQEEANRRKERAFGAEKLDQLQKEINLRKENLQLQKEYIDEINGFLKGDRDQLIASMKEIYLDIEFDEEGVIKDYQAIEDYILEQENWLIDLQNQYDELGEDAPMWIELFQRKLDDAREYMDRYEETLNLLEEKMDETSSQIDELSDALFEVITTKVELQIGINDDEASLLEHFLTKYEDNAYKAAEAISIFGDQATNQLKRIGIYQAGINDLLASKGLTLADLEKLDDSAVQKLIAEGDFTQEQIDSLREWRDGILEADEAIMELRTNISERVLDTFDQLNEKVEKGYSLFEHYNSILETYKDITDLMGRSVNQEQRKLIEDLNNAMLDNQKNTVASAKQRYEDLITARAEAQALYDEALAQGGEDAAQKYDEMLTNIDEALQEAQETYLDAWQESMDTVQNIFETTLDNIVASFDEAMGGTFGSLDYLKEAFDRQGELNEQYLADYDRLYELNKLQRDLNKTLSDTRGLTNRRELLELQRQINEYQENGVRLSQYDIDALRARYEIQQAYNDMMLSKEAKSTVRLNRDSEGNWGYVYTANQDEVAEAEQTYEDKLHEYQKLNDEYIQELQEKAIEAQSTYRDTLREIIEDVALTDEEKRARIEELNNWLIEQQQFFAQQSENVFGNQSTTLDRMLEAYAQTSAELVDSWEKTSLSKLTNTEAIDTYMNIWTEANDNFLNQLKDSLTNRSQEIDAILQITGTTVEQFSLTISSMIETTGEASKNAKEEVKLLSDVLNEEFNEAIKAAIDWETEYAAKMNAAADANVRMAKSLNDLITALAQIPSYNHLHDQLNEFLKVSKQYAAGEVDLETLNKYAAQVDQSLSDFIGMDEGGYTGSWGPEGKLAVLHEKENVFNKNDTENLLDAAKILRQIDMSASYMALGFGNMASPSIGESGMVVEQHLTIEEVSFPNATDRNEIEAAFENLANRAMQYVNRKNDL